MQAFWNFARDAAALLACLAGEGLLHEAMPARGGGGEVAALEALAVWLEQSLAAFDRRQLAHEAACRGDIEQLARLFGTHGGAHPPRRTLDEQLPGWPPDGYTCLHAAASTGQTAAVGWLLDHGATIDAPSCDGRRALHFAAEARDDARSAEMVTIHRDLCPRARSRCERAP